MNNAPAETALGKVEYDPEYGRYEGEVPIPFFKENVISIDFPAYHKKLNFSDLDKSIKRFDYGDKPATHIDFSINRSDDASNIAKIQFGVAKFIKENSELIEEAVIKNLNVVSDIYVDDYITGGSGASSEDEEKMCEFFARPDIIKSSIQLSSITILGAEKDGLGKYALNFSACWDEEHGFAMKFEELKFIDHAGASEFYAD